MNFEEKKNQNITNNTTIIQNVFLENREKISISGVSDVLSFDDQIIILETQLGLLTIKGENLRIHKLSLDTSEVSVEGEIYNIGYTDKEQINKSNNLIGRLFK